jgi:Ca2+-binding RTX toxin-like protein
LTRKRSALATACVAVAAMGLSAQSAFAGDIRVDTSTGGVKRLLFSEARVAAPTTTDPAATAPVPEVNQITITQSGATFTVKDAVTALAPGNGCAAVDANTVTCQSAGVTLLVFGLGLENDSFNNQTATPSQIMGGPGSDLIINTGAGNDNVDIQGQEADELQSCGAGTDTLTTDKFDTVRPNHACETINGVTQGGTTPPPPPGGGTTITPPTTAPINAAPAGTPAPVSAQQLSVPPKSGCTVSFIGTAANDRIDGSAQGDKEFGLAGDDFLRGQLGDDCLYGLAGNDSMFGEDGADLLVGGDGRDLAYGGIGNDQVFGNAGNDRLYGDAGNDRLSGGLGDDRLRGGSGADQLFGGLGNDLFFAGPGNDVISGGLGRDVIVADAGSDRINVFDRKRDVVNCGPGRDTVTADRLDVLRNCEVVTRRR